MAAPIQEESIIRHSYWRNFRKRFRFRSKHKKVNSGFDYYIKALKWFVLNAAFGIFPLILMGVVNWLTSGKEGQPQIDHLIYEGGVVLFVSIAIMGAVAVDYLLSGIKCSGIEIFALYIFPSFIAGFISLEFLLVCLHKLNKFALGIQGKKTIILIIISFFYCTLTKATFYLKEDSTR
jgi:hypothetical protein